MIGLVATSTHVQKIGRVAGLHYMHRIGKTGLFLWGRMGSAPLVWAWPLWLTEADISDGQPS